MCETISNMISRIEKSYGEGNQIIEFRELLPNESVIEEFRKCQAKIGVMWFDRELNEYQAYLYFSASAESYDDIYEVIRDIIYSTEHKVRTKLSYNLEGRHRLTVTIKSKMTKYTRKGNSWVVMLVEHDNVVYECAEPKSDYPFKIGQQCEITGTFKQGSYKIARPIAH